jgi:hypothetical protein
MNDGISKKGDFPRSFRSFTTDLLSFVAVEVNVRDTIRYGGVAVHMPLLMIQLGR